MREITVAFDLERKFILYTAIFVLAVGVGPFATYDSMTFWERVMFWSLDVYGGMVIITTFVTVAANSNILRSIPVLARMFLGALFAAIPTAALITFLYGAINPAIEMPSTYPFLVFEVVVFSIMILLTEFVVWPAIFGQQAEVAQSATVGHVGTKGFQDENPVEKSILANGFFERLPIEHRNSQIVSISMQDHYAEVTTTQGSTSLLMRLSDVEVLLQSYPGCRIHRSHWAASEYAVSISKRGRGHELLLSSGATLPVSDKYLSDARRLLIAG
jgi:hypothetical protein